METTLKSGAILMKFAQDVCVTGKYPGKKFLNSVGGRGTPHRPIFLACMETTLKSGAILMKFTQDVCMDEKISWTKNF